MVQSRDQIRKGPWTEKEDIQLVCYIGLFGCRRWDFVAKVSGLNRTGKSCRLRWVNYLQPGLKRGRMTPQEERLVLELHSRWGNRWSKIARKLPGRTDNEIKNFWRTHMRKMAEETKRQVSLMSSLTSTITTTMVKTPKKSQSILEVSSNLNGEGSCVTDHVALGGDGFINEEEEDYPMEQIWKEIASSEEEVMSSTEQVFYGESKEETCSFSSCPPFMDSPLWEFSSDSLLAKDEEEINMLAPMLSFSTTSIGKSRN